MAINKTQFTDVKVQDFLQTINRPEQVSDSLELIQVLEQLSGEKAAMWGPSIIGFGSYSYKYNSGHSGVAPLLGFSPRKTAISLYIYIETVKNRKLLEKLGKYKMGKACIYISKLDDIDNKIMGEMINETISFLERTHQRL